jgi:hypothetical protein
MSMSMSYYKCALSQLRVAISIIGQKKDDIVSMEAEYDTCLESYPCQGHGDLIVTYKDGTNDRLSCDSVEMGAIMWYFKNGSTHFTEYIDKDFAEYLTKNV